MIPGKGCRCVLDQPWVTIAEGCELAMALAASGEFDRAREMLHWQDQWRAEDASYWMGFQVEMNVPWPVERPAWTPAPRSLRQTRSIAEPGMGSVPGAVRR